jgi:hypothetical protein
MGEGRGALSRSGSGTMNTPFLKATKAIDPKAWDEFGRDAVDPWKARDIHAALDELRGQVELPPARDR